MVRPLRLCALQSVHKIFRHQLAMTGAHRDTPRRTVPHRISLPCKASRVRWFGRECLPLRKMRGVITNLLTECRFQLSYPLTCEYYQRLSPLQPSCKVVLSSASYALAALLVFVADSYFLYVWCLRYGTTTTWRGDTDSSTFRSQTAGFLVGALHMYIS